MTYVTVKQHRLPKQITWEDVLFENKIVFADQNSNTTGTITKRFDKIDQKFLDLINVDQMILMLEKFNSENEQLFQKDRESLYTHFKIPKKTGGFRPIDAPLPELQDQLTRLARILTEEFGLLYHTAAFAYITGRCTIDCVQRHQKNESNWFLKTDFSGFFPNTNLDFTMKMLRQVFPLSEICKYGRGEIALRKALSLGFLNDKLPQGTALSPCLTNIIMIPIDHALFNELAHRNIVYTRYADDMIISAKQKFPWQEVVGVIRKVLKDFEAPYILKDEKTRFGSRKGHNYNLGVCLNANNDITIGYKQKKFFKAAMTNYILDWKFKNKWDIDDVLHLQGLLSYYKMVEKEYFNGLIAKMNQKWSVDAEWLLSHPI